MDSTRKEKEINTKDGKVLGWCYMCGSQLSSEDSTLALPCTFCLKKIEYLQQVKRSIKL